MYARHPHAQSPSASSSVATTAGSVAASSAGSIRPSKSVSMSWHASTPRASCIVHATAAMDPSASGSIFVRAAPTARAQAEAPHPRQCRSRLLRRLSAPRTLVSAALLRVCRALGTGAPSEPGISFSSPPIDSHFLLGPGSSPHGQLDCLSSKQHYTCIISASCILLNGWPFSASAAIQRFLPPRWARLALSLSTCRYDRGYIF